jgi:hypothetical protein
VLHYNILIRLLHCISLCAHIFVGVGDETAPEPRNVLPVQHRKQTTSEYKMKFVEWPLQERTQPFVPEVAEQLDLFHETADTPNPYRSRSVLKADYPGHDVTELGASTGSGPRAGGAVAGTPSAAPGQRDANPKSFAWSLLDGGAQYQDADEEEDSEAQRRRRHAPKCLVDGNNCSEYTRTYGVPPPHASYVNLQRTAKPAVGEALQLFSAKNNNAQDAAEIDAARSASEYNAQFTGHKSAGSSDLLAETAASVAAHSQSHHPSQFAWALVNAGDKSLVDSPPREKRPVMPNQDMSEYNRKFQWPAGDGPRKTKASKAKKSSAAKDENAEGSGNQEDFAAAADTTHRPTVDSIIGLDAADLSATRWQSEYDLQCAELRAKQLSLLGGAAGHIAGLASKKHDDIPRNYAWEMPPAPVEAWKDPNEANTARPPQEQLSEYGTSFVAWPNSQRPTIKPNAVVETLNLFDTTGSGDSKSGSGSSTDGNERMQSEYANKFHAFDASSTVTKQAAYSNQRGVPLPPQFAWPRVDPEQPKSAAAPVKSALHIPFEEVSEYDSKFAWPAVIAPATICRPVTIGAAAVGSTASSVIVPIPSKGDAVDGSSGEVSQWMSNYDAQAASMLRASQLDAQKTQQQQDGAQHPAVAAGLISLRQDDVPHFYAWMDKEAAKKAATPVLLPRYGPNSLRTEHDASFVAWPVHKAEIVVPKATAETLNLFKAGGGSGGEGDAEHGAISSGGNATKAEPLLSEYDASFVGHSSRDLRAMENPYGNKRSSAIEEPKPAQFAWPLVDPQPAAAPEKKRSSTPNPNAAHSEYSTQFTWHSAEALAKAQEPLQWVPREGGSARRTTGPAPSADNRVVGMTGPDAAPAKAADWKSEYDDRCATLRLLQEAEQQQRQYEAPFIAGRATAARDEAPAYYAWEPAGMFILQM